MTLKSSHELKQLKTRLTKLQVELKEAKEVMAESTRSYQKIQHTEKDLQTRITILEKGAKELVVSEHAMLRYFERVMGVDLEEVKSIILSETLQSQWKTLGNGKYPLQGTGKAVIKDSVVVTIE